MHMRAHVPSDRLQQTRRAQDLHGPRRWRDLRSSEMNRVAGEIEPESAAPPSVRPVNRGSAFAERGARGSHAASSALILDERMPDRATIACPPRTPPTSLRRACKVAVFL